MKTKWVALGALSMALVGAGAAQAGDVTVTLTGVQARGGQLLVSLQTREQFMQPTGLGEIVQNPTAGTTTVTFRDVPAGDYAVSVLHDQNGDGQMQVSEIGIPTEGWAMSHGAELRGPPTFAQVKVAIPAAGAALTEPMFYWDGRIPGQ
ncbi:MAG TPA: DUF2141 domain-containing protein [Brevundimonas sp.]|jgi:uncharacterized protein (DUF2141 family)|uniref:DUF2141 domain-containing protein n=1 Tax=Brevundimonas sp. TaxID=1871086 RepID=UPI002BF4440C|nr:DUF2141 domain-containing protein [Brevundimonas sp.]HRH19411.1 DUF2141 domain-containing protein [Brevundimonas sp.]